jgi:hypothetical protein
VRRPFWALRIGRKRQARGWRKSRRTRSHIDRHAQRFEDFLDGRAAIDRGIDVKAEAIVAARRDRNGDRNQFLSSAVERPFRQRALGQSRESLHHFTSAAAQDLSPR